METVSFCVGHSFINSYFDHCISNLVKEDKVLTSHAVAAHLKVIAYIAEVHHYGERGGMASTFTISTHVLDFLNPDIVLIDLGSNDLAESHLSTLAGDTYCV